MTDRDSTVQPVAAPRAPTSESAPGEKAKRGKPVHSVERVERNALRAPARKAGLDRRLESAVGHLLARAKSPVAGDDPKSRRARRLFEGLMKQLHGSPADGQPRPASPDATQAVERILRLGKR